MREGRQDLQRATFVAATEGLRLASQRGVNATGYAALTLVYQHRFERLRPRIYNRATMPLSTEAEDYFKKMGGFVELASELEPRVDRQG